MSDGARPDAILSPTAMLALARRFTEAADVLQGSVTIVAPHFPVPHYLYAHGIELGLKAYLCGCEWTESQLRSLGHDLERCLEAAQEAGLGQHVQLSAEEVAAIEAVSDLYERKELEYSTLAAG